MACTLEQAAWYSRVQRAQKTTTHLGVSMSSGIMGACQAGPWLASWPMLVGCSRSLCNCIGTPSPLQFLLRGVGMGVERAGGGRQILA